MRLTKLFLMVALWLVPMLAFAQEAPAEVPDWLQSAVLALVGMLNGIPAVGHVLSIVFQVLGIASAIATALSVCAQVILTSLSVVSGWAGLEGVALKIKAIQDKVLPWLKWLSIFNVQKKG